MNTTSIHINNIQIYNLNLFHKNRTHELISNLNIHYNKINGYIGANIGQEKIDIELIDSFAILKEICNSIPSWTQLKPDTDDFRLGVNLLDSVIALLNTSSGHKNTRQELLELGWNLLKKLYAQFSYEDLKKEALIFSWLKHNDLISPLPSQRNHQYSAQNSEKLKFSPSKGEIDAFFEQNKSEIYKLMIYRMDPQNIPSDPFGQSDAANFYHYHQTLSNIIVDI